jgi:ubiquinone biosynthesis protein UbiJ
MIPHKKWLRAMPVVARLPELKKGIDDLQKRIERLEKKTEKT